MRRELSRPRTKEIVCSSLSSRPYDVKPVARVHGLGF